MPSTSPQTRQVEVVVGSSSSTVIPLQSISPPTPALLQADSSQTPTSSSVDGISLQRALVSESLQASSLTPPDHTTTRVEPPTSAAQTSSKWRRLLHPFSPTPVSRSDLESGVSPVAAPTGSGVAAPPHYEDLPARFSEFISPLPCGRSRNVSPPPAGGRPRRSRDIGEDTSLESAQTAVEPPPYGTSGARNGGPPPPPFGTKQSPDTMAKTYFFFGFILPIFWILGALTLCFKLEPIPESEGGKPIAQQEEMLRLFKASEEKWAYRCLSALVAFLVIVSVTVIAVVVSSR